MVSVIICSVNPSFLAQVSENIKDTIGVPYELIATDNRATGKGICQVYNEAAKTAKFDVLCFVHEDIEIETPNWGSKILAHFQDDPQLGLIGVAGSSYRPLTPSKWGGLGSNTAFSNIYQCFKDKSKPCVHTYDNPNNERISSVTCVDGVWLATTKKVFERFKFDEETFDGFHLYDLDFSMSVLQKYKVAVTFEVLIKHFSEGSYDKNWLDYTIKYYHKWNKHLPVNLAGLSEQELMHGEKVIFKYLINDMIALKYPISAVFKLLNANKRISTFNNRLYKKLCYHTIVKYLNAGKIRRIAAQKD
ncbi:hypothetical protein FPZ43_18765 [Mucilaginibacter pallidiroseus]|uniref:Streptomycin biosynthesis protein StrF domain-containing protein n=1 Tax=Mucilaginibacter pallidiroseus TaxID=2599295 RepID=A0A563TZM1_9SPHI|nr:glycosyltransferase [Mucilaginibacter pallidiroseus]TWR24051.1 hypothetical protein FPZ43_18765 [Mucilaginibacter pallidiroseus]